MVESNSFFAYGLQPLSVDFKGSVDSLQLIYITVPLYDGLPVVLFASWSLTAP